MRPDSRGRNRGGTENLGADLRGNKVMKQTPNYNLNKLEGPDTADLTRFNPNWDTLDTNLKQLSDDHVAHQAETVQNDDVHGLKTLFQNQQFENLVKNGDFESWSAGDITAPDSWNAFYADITQKVSGKYFPNGFRFQGAGNSYANQIVTPASEIQYWRGKTVTFGGWIKSRNGNIWIQDRGETWGSRSTAIVTSGNYEFVTKTTIIPETWSGNLVIQPYAYNGAEIIVEGLFMVEGELPVAFAKNPQDYIDVHAAEDATETQKGHVELATAAETTTGTDNTRAVHPAGLKVELDKKVNNAGGAMTGQLTISHTTPLQLEGAYPNARFKDTDVADPNDFMRIMWQNEIAYIQHYDASAGTWYDLLRLQLSNKQMYLENGVNQVWHTGNLPYEEGIWTPELRFGGATTGISYSSQTAKYTKIGRVIHWQLRLVLTSKGTATGSAAIAGLPFTSSSSQPFAVASIGSISYIVLPTDAFSINGHMLTNSAEILLRSDRNNAAFINLADVNFSDNTEIRAEGTYYI